MRSSRFQESAVVWTARSSLGLSPLALAVWVLVGVCASAQTLLPDLIRAVKSGDAAEVRRLTDSGASVNATDSQGMTPLIWAANQGDGEFVRLLVSKGADPNAADAFGWTALIHAAGAGHTDAVKALLDCGAAVSARANNAATPLIAAAAHFETAKVLLAHGADPRAQASDGTTALLAAKNLGNEAVVRLIEAAVSPELAQGQGAPSTEQPPAAAFVLPQPPVMHTQAPGGGLASGGTLSELPTNTAKQDPTEGRAETNQASPSQLVSDPPDSLSLPELKPAEGTSPPDTEPSPSSPTQTFVPPPEHPADGVYLQVGAFGSTADAEQLRAQLSASGHLSVLHTHSGLHLLLVGPFQEQYSAIDYRAKLQRDGFESFIARLPEAASAAPTAYSARTAYIASGEANHRQPAEHATTANEFAARPAPASIPEGRNGQENRSRPQIYLQVGAFRAEGNALLFARGVTDPEYAPSVQSGADGWFRVVLGPFASREAALAYREKLMAQGRDAVLRLP